MAKFGSKFRSYQHHKQQKVIPPLASTTIYGPQIHQSNHQSIHHSPTTRAPASNNLITNSSLLKSSRGPKLITTSTSVAHFQPPYPVTKTLDQINYLHEHQNQQSSNNDHHFQISNFDRSRSTAIINSMTTKQQRHQSTTMNFPRRNNADDLGKFSNSPPLGSIFSGTKQPFSEL